VPNRDGVKDAISEIQATISPLTDTTLPNNRLKAYDLRAVLVDSPNAGFTKCEGLFVPYKNMGPVFFYFFLDLFLLLAMPFSRSAFKTLT